MYSDRYRRYAAQEHHDWMKRVAEHLPDWSARTFSLRGMLYWGCGTHYALEARLGRVITLAQNYEQFFNSEKDRIANRIIDEMVVAQFVAQLVKAEKSALTQALIELQRRD